jgi:YVTN family beta-propeller protein
MTAYVANIGDNSVTPIAVATGIPVAPIPVGHQPAGIAITPNGTTAYVTTGDNAVTPIDLATRTPGIREDQSPTRSRTCRPRFAAVEPDMADDLQRAAR